MVPVSSRIVTAQNSLMVRPTAGCLQWMASKSDYLMISRKYRSLRVELALELVKKTMLLQFSVGNFKSFRHKTTFSLEATADDWREDDNIAHIQNPKLRLVRAAALFGANAGGKSNFIDAMVQFRQLVLGSSKDSQRGEPIAVTPHRLHSDTENAPTLFEALFMRDGKRYRYGFETTREAITAEWLYVQAGSIRETCLFTRDKGRIIPHKAFKEGKGLEDRTRPNALFLSVAAQFNGRIAGEVTSWMEQFRTISGLHDAGYLNFTADLLNDKQYGDSIRELIKQADVGIEDLIKQEIDKEGLVARIPKEFPEAIRELIAQNSSGGSVVKSIHQRFTSDEQPAGKVEFDLHTEESAGTRQFFAFAGPFLHTLREGSVLVVDELDARLHPLLTRQLVALFNSSTNVRNAQLIFATHDQGLLDQRRVRRDQIWFVEKDQRGASTLFCLEELTGVRKDANFEKEYLLGQFGGVPHVGNFQRAVMHVKE